MNEIRGSALLPIPRKRAGFSMAATRKSPNSPGAYQRKLLTVLFGQSGLGKTSVLRAGLVPRLRAQGYCPIYVRIDYRTRFPGAGRADQAGHQPHRAPTRASGRRPASRPPANRCGNFCITATMCCAMRPARRWIPLLIFDQFEEIFTLAQSDAVRPRARRVSSRNLLIWWRTARRRALEAKLRE